MGREQGEEVSFVVCKVRERREFDGSAAAELLGREVADNVDRGVGTADVVSENCAGLIEFGGLGTCIMPGWPKGRNGRSSKDEGGEAA